MQIKPARWADEFGYTLDTNTLIWFSLDPREVSSASTLKPKACSLAFRDNFTFGKGEMLRIKEKGSNCCEVRFIHRKRNKDGVFFSKLLNYINKNLIYLLWYQFNSVFAILSVQYGVHWKGFALIGGSDEMSVTMVTIPGAHGVQGVSASHGAFQSQTHLPFIWICSQLQHRIQFVLRRDILEIRM